MANIKRRQRALAKSDSWFVLLKSCSRLDCLAEHLSLSRTTTLRPLKSEATERSLEDRSYPVFLLRSKNQSTTMQDPFTQHHGCFVYLVQEPLRPRVRPCPHADYTAGHRFHPGDLVSVDAVRLPDTGEKNSSNKSNSSSPFTTAYLRLSDGSGWLPQTSPGKINVQQIPVTAGLWKFYIDNYPVGQALRRHPIDSAEMHLPPTDSIDQKPIIYPPMQLVHVDRVCTHPTTGICWYRVQGTDNGWIVDRRLNSSVNMLVPATKVQTGMFAFVAIRSLSVRSLCSTSDHVMTQHAVKQGQVVTVDVIRTWPSLRQNPSAAEDSDTENHSASGPYLRLTDGSGWVFVRKEGMEIMRQIPILAVQAQLEVLNYPVGLSLRRFPQDDQDKIIHQDKSYRPGTLLQADLQVTDGEGVRYYHIVGTDGWLFDRRGRESMLKVLNEGEPTSDDSVISSQQPSMAVIKPEDGWTTEFVRGVASTVDRLYEVEYHPNSQVLCFESTDHVRIDVYCATRTVGVKPTGKAYTWYRNCTPRALWQLLSMDLVDMVTKSSATSRRDVEVTVNYMQTIIDVQTSKAIEEEEARNHLLRIDQEIDDLLEKRLSFLTRVKAFDAERNAAAELMKKLAEERKTEPGRVPDSAVGRESIFDKNARDFSSRETATPANRQVKNTSSGSESRYSRRSRATVGSDRAFSTRSNVSKPVNERIDDLLELKSNETDDNSDAPFRTRDPREEVELTDDDEESIPNFNSEDLGDGSSFDSDHDGDSYTDSEGESH